MPTPDPPRALLGHPTGQACHEAHVTAPCAVCQEPTQMHLEIALEYAGTPFICVPCALDVAQRVGRLVLLAAAAEAEEQQRRGKASDN